MSNCSHPTHPPRVVKCLEKNRTFTVLGNPPQVLSGWVQNLERGWRGERWRVRRGREYFLATVRLASSSHFMKCLPHLSLLPPGSSTLVLTLTFLTSDREVEQVRALPSPCLAGQLAVHLGSPSFLSFPSSYPASWGMCECECLPTYAYLLW